MTTRQRAMEQECREKLKWDAQKIANSTPDAMLRALEQNGSASACSSASRKSTPLVSPIPRCVGPPLGGPVAMILPLRVVIRVKMQGLLAGDLLDEDVRFLRSSLERDRHRLDNEMVALRAYIGSRKLEETKKHQMRELLQKVLQSVQDEEDVARLQAVDLSLVHLQDEIGRLTIVLQEDVPSTRN